jgi:hypothetical protein
MILARRFGAVSSTNCGLCNHCIQSRIVAQRRRSGHQTSHFDAQIEVIASCAGAAIVTPNVTDFSSCGVEVINPWKK